MQKPYEPPALGKSSRITPVGGEEVSNIENKNVKIIKSIEANLRKTVGWEEISNIANKNVKIIKLIEAN